MVARAVLFLRRSGPFAVPRSSIRVRRSADGTTEPGEPIVYFGAPTGFPSGATAYHVPPTPWPLVSPALVSPEKV